jgi:predicted nucleic-acid-binding Zn-ribbon protein
MYVNCEKCGGKVVLARIGTVPEGLCVTGLSTTGVTPVEAHVCLECGYAALYAQDPRVLQAEHRD